MPPAFLKEQAIICRSVKIALSRVRSTSLRFSLNGPVTSLAWAMRRAGIRVSARVLFDAVQAHPSPKALRAYTLTLQPKL